MKFEQITVKVFMKRHIKASYMLVFSKEEQLEDLKTTLNDDVDFITIGNDVVRRLDIKRLEVKYE